MRLAVFGYGSLVSPASAAQTLGRPVARRDPRPRSRAGARGWTLGRDNAPSEKTFARPTARCPASASASTSSATPDARQPNGALIELTEAELDRLDLREIRYDRVDVTAAVAAAEATSFDRVITYVAKPRAPPPRPRPRTRS